MMHLFRRSTLGLLGGLCLSLVAAGCTVTTRPATRAAYRTPYTPYAAPAPAQPTYSAPPARRPRIDPAFRQALVDYSNQVRAIRFEPEYRQQMAMRAALQRLDDVIELIPYAGRGGLVEVAADRIRDDAARVGYAGGAAQADARAIREALDESALVLDRLAQGRYRGAPGVQAQSFRLRQQVDTVYPWTPIRRQDAQIIGAMQAAENVLGAILDAAERGEVY